jgi:hypothetical protein
MTTPATQTQRPPNATAFPPVPVAAQHELLIRDAFDDIALLVGGVAALHNLDDDLLWTLMKRLDRIRVKLLRSLLSGATREEFEPAAVRPPRMHAAVDEFLARNRGRMGE